MEFNIKVVNIKTGEVILDQDTNAIIAGIDTGKTTAEFCVTECDTPTLLATIEATECAIGKVLKSNAKLSNLYTLGKELKKIIDQLKV